HQFNGTRDFSAFLTIPACIQFMQTHQWKSKINHCKERTLHFAKEMASLLETEPLAPLNDEFYGQLCSTRIRTNDPVKLQRLLFESYKIEIPVMQHGDNCYIRFSYQVFNTDEELNYLLASLTKIKQTTHLIH